MPHGDTMLRAGDTIVIDVAAGARQAAFARVVAAAQGPSSN